MPTQGFNVKSLIHDGFKLDVWDIGGSVSARVAGVDAGRIALRNRLDGWTQINIGSGPSGRTGGTISSRPTAWCSSSTAPTGSAWRRPPWSYGSWWRSPSSMGSPCSFSATSRTWSPRCPRPRYVTGAGPKLVIQGRRVMLVIECSHTQTPYKTGRRGPPPAGRAQPSVADPGVLGEGRPGAARG